MGHLPTAALAVVVLGGSTRLLEAASVPKTLPDGGADPGLVVEGGTTAKTEAAGRADSAAASPAIVAFIAVLARHRVFERELDPPPV
jgi:catalase